MAQRVDSLKKTAVSGALNKSHSTDFYRIKNTSSDDPSPSSKDFLAGCGLPKAWDKKPQWRILEIGFDLGFSFLTTWQTWRIDPNRPHLLHFVSVQTATVSADSVRNAAHDNPDLIPLAAQLQSKLWGLLPGLHRLVFEDARIQLTLCIGPAKAMLKQQQLEVDAVYLNSSQQGKYPDSWDLHTIKAVASCCRRGTRIETFLFDAEIRKALIQCGFEIQKTSNKSAGQCTLRGIYNPAWAPKKAIGNMRPPSLIPSSCIVIGAGLAGAALAASLARRGWQVTVLDAAATPATGASGLPAGLLVPHVSVDDSLLSKLSRSGVRITLEQAKELLEEGQDWRHSGVLQRDLDGTGPQLPAAWLKDWPEAATQWSSKSTKVQNLACGLSPQDEGIWHASAGWIKPAQLVKAWLKTPGVSWQGNARVVSLRPHSQDQTGWQALDADNRVLAKADLVVIAAAFDSEQLAQTLGTKLKLHPIRGQVSWGLHQDDEVLHTSALNGHGSFTPALPLDEGLAWMVGASYERDCTLADIKPQFSQTKAIGARGGEANASSNRTESNPRVGRYSLCYALASAFATALSGRT
jgi:tRNA 5-methylaminomethyl-2-thiouridine biosynthesis bifunctional protein